MPHRTTHIATIFYDAEGTIAFWSRNARILYGFTEDEIFGKPVNALSVPIVAEQSADVSLPDFFPQTSTVYRCRRRTSNNMEITVDCRSEALYNADGSFRYYIEHSQHVAEPNQQANIEPPLLKQPSVIEKADYTQTDDESVSLVQTTFAFMLTPELTVDWYNTAAEKLFSQRLNLPIGSSLQSILYAVGTPPEKIAECGRMMQLGNAKSCVLQWIVPPGEHMWIEAQVTPIIGENATGVSSSMFVATNITARLAIDATLQESELRYRSIISSMSEGLVVHNAEGHITAFNNAALHILQVTEAQLLGKTSTDPQWYAIDEHGNRLIGEQHPAMRALKTGTILRDEILGLRRNNGSITWLSINATPLFLPSDTTANAVIVTFRDITKERLFNEQLVKREEFYRLLLNTSYDAVCVHRADGLFLNVSAAALTLFGYEPHELEQRTPLAFIHREDGHIIRNNHLPKVLRGEVASAIYRFRCKDGRYIWVESVARLIEQAGEEKRILSVTRDIHERYLLQQELRKNEELFRLILDSTYDIITMHSLDGTYIYVPRSITGVLEWQPEELIGKSAYEIMHPEDATRILANTPEELDFSKSFREVVRARTKNGDYRILETVARIIQQENEPPRVISSARDITQQKAIEEKLRQSEALYRLILDTTSDMIWLHSADGVILHAPESSRRILGYDPAELIGKTPYDIMHPDDIEQARLAGHQQVLTLNEAYFKVRLLRKSGDYIWCETLAHLYQEEGKPPLIISATRDVHRQEMMEQELRNSEEMHRIIFNSGNDLFIVHEEDGTFFMISESVRDILGFAPDELTGTSPMLLFHPEDVNNIKTHVMRRLLESGEVRHIHRMRHKRGYYIWLESVSRTFTQEGQPRRIFTASRDITRQRKLEEDRRKLSDDLFLTLHNINGQVYKYRRHTDNNFYLVFSEGTLAEELDLTTRKYAGKEMRDILSPELYIELVPFYNRCAQGEKVQFETHAFGRWFLSTLQPIFQQGQVVEIVGSAVDITRRIVAEQELEREKRTTMRAIAQTQEEERSRIASELHDGVGHLLSVVKMRLSSLFEATLADDPYLEDTITLLDNAIKEMRSISHQLMSYTLNSLGIKAALEDLIFNLKTSNTLQVHTTLQLDDPPPLSRQEQIIVYRIIQELLHNVIKHSEATAVTIEVIQNNCSLVLVIEDNGKGFTPEVQQKGLGFTSIANRIRLLNAVMDIDSAPGQGTAITIEIPLSNEHSLQEENLHE